MTNFVVRPIFNPNTGKFDECRVPVASPEEARRLLGEVTAIFDPWSPAVGQAFGVDVAHGHDVTAVRIDELEGIERAHLGRLVMAARRSGKSGLRAGFAEAMASAGCVMPSDTQGVLDAYREDPALVRPDLREAQAKSAASFTKMLDTLGKPARTLPGALSEAGCGHRLGGWGASEHAAGEGDAEAQ